MSRWRVLPIVLLLAGLAASWFAFNRYRAEQEARSVGIDVSQTVTARFAGMNALKVGTVSGDVVASSTTTAFFDMLPVNQRSRAPYSVDYFVDLSGLSIANYRWNARIRTMSIDVPDITVGAPNIDGAKAATVQQGLYISRQAGIALQKQAFERAGAAARRTAQDPKYMAQARANARRAIAQLAAAPLEAAGLGDVKIAIRFPTDPKPASVDQQSWDESTPIAEILAAP